MFILSNKLSYIGLHVNHTTIFASWLDYTYLYLYRMGGILKAEISILDFQTAVWFFSFCWNSSYFNSYKSCHYFYVYALLTFKICLFNLWLVWYLHPHLLCCLTGQFMNNLHSHIFFFCYSNISPLFLVLLFTVFFLGCCVLVCILLKVWNMNSEYKTDFKIWTMFIILYTYSVYFWKRFLKMTNIFPMW